MKDRLCRAWYWLTLDDPIGTPVAVLIGLAVVAAVAVLLGWQPWRA